MPDGAVKMPAFEPGPLSRQKEFKHIKNMVITEAAAGAYPMRTRLKLFKEWGITFGKPYEIAEQSARQVEYADRRHVEEEIIRRHAASEDVPEEAETEAAASGGPVHTPTQAITFEEFVQPKGPERK